MSRIATMIVGAMIAGTASATAQGFTSVGTPDNTSAGEQFWDNPSNDGSACNIGYVVTGVASSCSNQRPASWLPYTGPTPSAYLEASGGGFQPFTFVPGNWSFSALGDIAGQNTDWGYYDVGTSTRTSLNGGVPGTPVLFSAAWGLWIKLTNGNYAYSGMDNQFALFGFGVTPILGPDFIAGLEDIDTGKDGNSDRDYQDVILALRYETPGTPAEVIPEPATLTLLATGLVGMAGLGRRKRK